MMILENVNMPREPLPQVFDFEVDAFKSLKKAWMKIKNSSLFLKFRHSRFNPYHRNIPKIKAETLEEARMKAHALALENKKNGKKFDVHFTYNGTRYTIESLNLTPQQEYQQYGAVFRGHDDVSSRIPRNSKGELDLFAEDPIVVAIVPIEGPGLVGHACMQYKDRVVNRLITSIHTDPLYPKYGKYAEYYFIYPSQLGIDSQKLLRAMDRHIIKHGQDKYLFFSNNCARNVAKIFRQVGINDFKFYGFNKLGLVFTNPGNNPFNLGIKAWCFKHGVHVRPDEMAEFDRRHPIDNVKERRAQDQEIRDRYDDYRKRWASKTKLASARKKTAEFFDDNFHTDLAKKEIPLKAKLVEKALSDKFFYK